MFAAEEEVDNENPTQNKEVLATRKFSEPFHDIAELCLQCDSSHRPGINQLLAHPFFKQCRKTNTTLLNLLKHIKPLNERFMETLGNKLDNYVRKYIYKCQLITFFLFV